jgi:uncharacterized protein DUF4160
MPTIGRIGSLEVMMFYNDHGTPHFHVFGHDFSAKFTVAGLTLLSSKGRIRQRDIRAVEQWGKEHHVELSLNWDFARAGKPLKTIWN